MNKGMKYWAAMAVFAFASAICFFNINGAFADAHNLNGVVGFLGAGILCGLIAIFCLWKVSKMSDD